MMMRDELSNVAHLSQFETAQPRRRLVILGASNLSMKFPMVVESALTMIGGPLEFVVAKGFGRSYGQESKFFGKKFPGILQSGLWDAMRGGAPNETLAMVADVGNDLAYEAPVETILGWIETTLDRLAQSGARVVLNNLPLASLRSVGASRYRLFRELFFPGCKLPRAEMLRRAERLGVGLARMAAARETPIFTGDCRWYGLDPIHPRRSCSGEIWRLMLGALAPHGAPPTLESATSASAWELRRLKPENWSQFGLKRRAAQPCARLADGTTIALF